MSATIEINQKQINKNEKLQLHFLPAKINGDGNANVNTYFNNYTRSENDILTNSLRGYPLQGRELNVPENFKALVLQESQNPSDSERTLRVSGSFEKFTYWNYDKLPSKGDAYVQALKWFELAEELAKPINESDVLDEMESYETDNSKENDSK